MSRKLDRDLNVARSWTVSVLRLGAGWSVRSSLGPRPAQPLELYDFERCPHCRVVREALSELDLDVAIYPCPKGGTRFRPQLAALAGKERVPFLVDPNTGDRLLEASAILAHLARHYGGGAALSVPIKLRPLSVIASLSSGAHGKHVRPSKPAPAQPLELWSFEISPYCRLVRERLCELELPYLLHNVAKGSAKREAFVARSGKMMVPYLVDPNTGIAMHESADILAYLDATYGA